MYKTVSTVIPAGQQASATLVIPGKLVAITVAIGATAADVYPIINCSPEGGVDIFNSSSQRVQLTNQVDNRMLMMPPNMPVGSASYLIYASNAAVYPRPCSFIYEDSPSIY
ncbi:hypothetical protein LPP1_g27 [Leptolyngbya phage LPP-1]|uniref:Uncharacterized protein n=1 Tax=Leptolyngbya phage LPP-1 TaxID=2996049 RepID=A0AAE9TKL6_9CAUD|nr:hypothetical protein LPP1_g27 [Leptolyngbya phage LPP-1]